MIRDTIAGESIRFYYVTQQADLLSVARFVRTRIGKLLAIDTESTSYKCYLPDWKLRTVQVGTGRVSYVIPARYRKFISWLMQQQVKWVGHNLPHDFRSIDQHLGYATGAEVHGDTFIPAHHMDSRNQQDGGTGHGLKELACAHVDPDAGKWEKALKIEFKKLRVAIPGEYYKSGPNKGLQKTRAARLAEGWSLIDPKNPVYIAYAASDPIITYRLWLLLRVQVSLNPELYAIDCQTQLDCDTLHRRGMLVDVSYTLKLQQAYRRVEQRMMVLINQYGCDNPNSTAQLANVLEEYDFKLTERTPTGKAKVDSKILRAAVASNDPALKEFAGAVLLLKQVSKRRTAYVDGILGSLDSDQRLHPSIKPLAARTARMSVSDPALQQLPTKDNEGDEWLLEYIEDTESSDTFVWSGVKLLSADTIRRIIVADPGYTLFSVDFDQIELRIAAALAGEESMIQAARDGVSLHVVAATRVFGADYTPDQYRYTKNLNFGWLFGGGPPTLAKQTGLPIATTSVFVRDYENSFRALVAYKRRQQDMVLRMALSDKQYRMLRVLRSRMMEYRPDTEAGRNGRSMIRTEIDKLLWGKYAYITTPFGRRLIVEANKAYRVVNYEVQSTARDVLANAMRDVMRRPKLARFALLPIHDELLGQAPTRIVERVMERFAEIMSREFQGVPLTAGGKIHGTSWGQGYATASHQ